METKEKTKAGMSETVGILMTIAAFGDFPQHAVNICLM